MKCLYRAVWIYLYESLYFIDSFKDLSKLCIFVFGFTEVVLMFTQGGWPIEKMGHISNPCTTMVASTSEEIYLYFLTFENLMLKKGHHTELMQFTLVLNYFIVKVWRLKRLQSLLMLEESICFALHFSKKHFQILF